MTISTTESSIAYNGNGVTLVFAVPFRFLVNSDLVVTRRNVADIESTLALNTDYTLTGANNDAGGTLTMAFALSVNDRLVINRVVGITQETDYPEGGNFPAEAHERALDRLTMISQQLMRSIGRCLRFPASDTAVSVIPSQMSRANKILSFDGFGQPTVSLPISDSAQQLRTDLASIGGSGLVGFDKNEAYPPNTVGKTLATISQGGQGGSSTELNVKDPVYNVTGNDNPADAAGISQAMNDAISQNKTLVFPDGVYNLGVNFPIKAGRLFLLGLGNVTIKGNLDYYEPNFPVSADTPTPLTPTSKFFSAVGINFQSTNATHALTLRTDAQPGFIRTSQLIGCKFYGPNGLLQQHMIGFSMDGCGFYNSGNGARLEGCVNAELNKCTFENQAGIGLNITGHATQTARDGGENVRINGTEFDVCTYGILAENHLWLSINNCLLDYCDVPLFLSGSSKAKASQTYFGAANVASSRFSTSPYYIAPIISGCSVYGRPAGNPLGTRVVGFSADQCEFVAYVGGSQPIVYIDGYISGTYPRSSDDNSIQNSYFYAVAAHTRPNLLEISAAAIARVSNNRFRSDSVSTSMANAYRTNDVLDYKNENNSFYLCRQSGNPLTSIHENTGSVGLPVVPNNTYLKWKNSSNVDTDVLILNTADNTILRTVKAGAAIGLNDYVGNTKILADDDPTNATALWVQGQLRRVYTGSSNSYGGGFSHLLVIY